MMNQSAKSPLLYVALVLFAFTIAISACKHEIDTPLIAIPTQVGIPCNTDTVYFENQILPILVSTCAMATCHNTQFSSLGFDMTSYESIKKIIVAKDAGRSFLYQTITSQDPTSQMPISPSPAWTTEQANLLAKWINQGALKNACNTDLAVCDTTKITYSNFIQPLIVNQCQGCHVQSAWGGGVVLNTYNDVKAIAQNGRLLGAMAAQTGFSQMPKFQKQLPVCTVKKVEAWVKGGMKQ